MLNFNKLTGSHDLVLVTLDTLRFDAAQGLFEQKKLPNFEKLLPANGWEKRHAPGSFTFASHHAIFAGFLPRPNAFLLRVLPAAKLQQKTRS
ncbi:MAG: hypothetical protein MI784_00890 [Cytophagales bacterium]|nr:hypothetical protein [Cytophagales bacterium]